MARRRYRLDKVDIAASGERKASWGFAGGAVNGSEHSFVVADSNYRQRNHWEFVARVPKEAGGRIEVRPTLLPNDRAWADLDRRSLTFNRATRSRYRGGRYCQVALADPQGRRTKDIVHKGEKDKLPAWFRQIGSRIRVKESVRATKGTDGHALVVIVGNDDYATMIRLFFAMKVWVLKEKIVLP
jgi:hypothetical protein